LEVCYAEDYSLVTEGQATNPKPKAIAFEALWKMAHVRLKWSAYPETVAKLRFKTTSVMKYNWSDP